MISLHEKNKQDTSGSNKIGISYNIDVEIWNKDYDQESWSTSVPPEFKSVKSPKVRDHQRLN